MLTCAKLFSQVVCSLLRNKLRSFLTMAGIAWGVASIVLIVAMGDGFKEGQRNNYQAARREHRDRVPGRTEKQAGGQRAGRRIRLNYADVRDIRAECFLVRNVVAELENQARSHQSASTAALLRAWAWRPIYRSAHHPDRRGRFLNDAGRSRGAARLHPRRERAQAAVRRTRSLVGSEIRAQRPPFRIDRPDADKKTRTAATTASTATRSSSPIPTMVRDLPPNDPTVQPGIAERPDLYAGVARRVGRTAREQVRRVLGRNHSFDPDDKGAVASGTRWKAPNWWTASSSP